MTSETVIGRKMVSSTDRSEEVSKGIEFYDVQVKELLHLAVSLGSFVALDKYLKNVFLENAIRFPSALFGMLSLFVLLSTLSAINTGIAASLLHHRLSCFPVFLFSCFLVFFVFLFSCFQ